MRTRAIVAILAFFALLSVAKTVFVVGEWEQAIITQFGNPVGDPIITPGLKFKIPYVQKVHRFERRFLEWEGSVAELPTKDKVFILLDAYARWRIDDPLLFFQRLRNERGAQSRLDDILDGETRNAIARHNLIEVIRVSNRQPVDDDSVTGEQDTLAEISDGRNEIRKQILEAALLRTSDLGLEILDIQFKRINYGEQVLRDVHARMISERTRISDRFRSEGQGEKAEILGNMERELQRIQSEAYETAEKIRGQADAEATQIYAAAYNRSADSRSFYEFLMSMDTLEATVDAETWMILSTDGDLFRFLEGSGQ